MEEQKSHPQHIRLKHLSTQLAASERLLQNHPSTKGKWTILQTLLHGLHLQTQWIFAGPSARLLMAFQTALHAQGVEQSQTGFLGPSLQHAQQSLARLMQFSLHPSERDLAPLLVAFTQVLTMGMIFIANHLLETWRSLFPSPEDRGASEKAGELLKELGLTFLLGSRAIESAFHSIGKGLGLKESSQKRISDIGLCLLLILMILSQEVEFSLDDEFLETIKHLMQPTLSSIEQAFQEAETQQAFERDQASLAMNQIRLIRQALNGWDKEELRQALSISIEMAGISLQEVKRDIRRLNAFCTQLNGIFKNIFDRTSMAATTIQAA